MFFIAVGMGNMPKTLYVVPVTGNYGFSRGEFSMVFSIITMTGLITNVFYGYLEKHLGVRYLATLGLILMAIGYFIFSKATSLDLFYLGAVIDGIGFPLCTITTISVLINNWFGKNEQGTMLGLVVAGSGFGGSLFSLIIGKYILTHGTSASYLLTSIILALSTIPIFIFTRSKPYEKEINGVQNHPQANAIPDVKETVASSPKPDKAIKFFKQPAIWFTLIAVFLIGIVTIPTNDTMPPFLTEKGFSAESITKIASAIWLAQATAKIILGLINDRIGAKFCLYTGLGSYLLGAVILILSNNIWTMWIYVIFAGIFTSAIAVLVPLYVRAVIGGENYGKYIGIFMATLTAGIGLGNPIINFIYDVTRTYTVILSVFIFVGIAAIFLSHLSLRRAS